VPERARARWAVGSRRARPAERRRGARDRRQRRRDRRRAATGDGTLDRAGARPRRAAGDALARERRRPPRRGRVSRLVSKEGTPGSPLDPLLASVVVARVLAEPAAA